MSVDRLPGDELRHRAILDGAVLHGVRHEAGIDHDRLAAGSRAGRKAQVPGPETSSRTAEPEL